MTFNDAHGRVFQPGRLTVGLMTPVDVRPDRMADVREALELAALADRLGFAALWTRDVPLMIPQGSDNTASALDDPFLWLGALAGATRDIAVGAAAIVLPLRHPLHVAKAALSLDRLSGGRFILGMGSGDRPAEFAAFGQDLDHRAEAFRNRWATVRAALSPDVDERLAVTAATGGFEVLPAPARRIPMIVVGSARQSLQWTATHADAWATYHREEARQEGRIELWQRALEQKGVGAKPFVQSVQLELLADPDAAPEPLELGLRTGRRALVAYLRRLRAMGVAHVLFNLGHVDRGRPAREVIEELGNEVLPALVTGD
ncbi:LLM class flavin-dependent oxidoreductase [Roseateles noduli]|nr:LLM class flavin-dependent oxidoreductase [Roseateles noduli]